MERKYKVWEVINANFNLNARELIDKLKLMYANDQLDTVLDMTNLYYYSDRDALSSLMGKYAARWRDYSVVRELFDLLDHLPIDTVVSKLKYLNESMVSSYLLIRIDEMNKDRALTLISQLPPDVRTSYRMCVFFVELIARGIASWNEISTVLPSDGRGRKSDIELVVSAVFGSNDDVITLVDSLRSIPEIRRRGIIRALMTSLAVISEEHTRTLAEYLHTLYSCELLLSRVYVNGVGSGPELYAERVIINTCDKSLREYSTANFSHETIERLAYLIDFFDQV